MRVPYIINMNFLVKGFNFLAYTIGLVISTLTIMNVVAPYIFESNIMNESHQYIKPNAKMHTSSIFTSLEYLSLHTPDFKYYSHYAVMNLWRYRKWFWRIRRSTSPIILNSLCYWLTVTGLGTHMDSWWISLSEVDRTKIKKWGFSWSSKKITIIIMMRKVFEITQRI